MKKLLFLFIITISFVNCNKSSIELEIKNDSNYNVEIEYYNPIMKQLVIEEEKSSNSDFLKKESRESKTLPCWIAKAPVAGMYHAFFPSDSIPFVKNGDYVEEGQLLCYIEDERGIYCAIEADRPAQIIYIYKNEGDNLLAGDELFLMYTE